VKMTSRIIALISLILLSGCYEFRLKEGEVEPREQDLSDLPFDVELVAISEDSSDIILNFVQRSDNKLQFLVADDEVAFFMDIGISTVFPTSEQEFYIFKFCLYTWECGYRGVYLDIASKKFEMYSPKDDGRGKINPISWVELEERLISIFRTGYYTSDNQKREGMRHSYKLGTYEQKIEVYKRNNTLFDKFSKNK